MVCWANNVFESKPVTDHKAQRLQHVAELLNAVGRDTETKILSTLEEANPNLASEIRE